MSVLGYVLAAVLGAVAAWLWLRSRTAAPNTPEAKAETEKASKDAEAAAQQTAKEVANAPVDDIAARIDELRARGRAGK